MLGKIFECKNVELFLPKKVPWKDFKHDMLMGLGQEPMKGFELNKYVTVVKCPN